MEQNIFHSPFSDDTYKRGRDLLKDGQLIIMPTETVYGIAGNAENDQAIEAIYHIKGRPSYNPLIVHVASLDVAEKYALLSHDAYKLAEHFWPGPLTLVLPVKDNAPLSRYVTAGLSSVAVRIPRGVSYDILKGLDFGVAMPSANVSTRLSPSDFMNLDDVITKGVSAVYDDGRCPIGVESTVLDLTGEKAKVLRFGYVLPDDLSAILGVDVVVKGEADKIIKSPGMMLKHYSPRKNVRIDVVDPTYDEFFLGFGDVARCTLNLSPTGDLLEASYNLYSMLHTLDCNPQKDGIAVAPIPREGLGLAINDRLKRASYKDVKPM